MDPYNSIQKMKKHRYYLVWKIKNKLKKYHEKNNNEKKDIHDHYDLYKKSLSLKKDYEDLEKDYNRKLSDLDKVDKVVSKSDDLKDKIHHTINTYRMLNIKEKNKDVKQKINEFSKRADSHLDKSTN